MEFEDTIKIIDQKTFITDVWQGRLWKATH